MSCPPLCKHFDLGDRDKQVAVHCSFIFSIIIPLSEKRVRGVRKLWLHGGVLLLCGIFCPLLTRSVLACLSVFLCLHDVNKPL